MREYEFIYVVQPDIEPERLEEVHTKLESTITGGQGQILLRDDWGKRKLAYEIQKFQKGQYLFLQLLGDGKFIPEMERGLRIDPDVLRYMTIVIDDNVKDIGARIEWGKKETAERAERHAERERLDAERRERERVEAEERAARAEKEAAARVEKEAAAKAEQEASAAAETAAAAEPEAAAAAEPEAAAAAEPEAGASEPEAAAAPKAAAAAETTPEPKAEATPAADPAPAASDKPADSDGDS